MRAPCLLGLLLAGCWNFEALTQGGPRPDGGAVDLSETDLICQGTALIEDCADGVDNDGDCMTDCLDDECATKALCQPIVGLLGYGQITRGGSPAVCPPGQSLSGPATFYDRIDAAKNDCVGCVCGPPNPAGCASELRLYSKKNCNNNDLYQTGGKVTLPDAMACTALNAAVMGAASAIVDAPRPVCQPNSAAATPNPAWVNTARLCVPDAAQKDCATPSCVLSQLRNQRPCVAVSGNECPAPFTQKETWYRTYTDRRTCDCTCGGTASLCEGAARLTSLANCDAASTRVDLTPGQCKDTPGGFQSVGFDYTIKPKVGAVCTPSSVARGTLMLEDGMSVCCLPAS